MIPTLALLVGIYFVWTVSLVCAMVATDVISLLVPTVTFIVTFPLSILLSLMLTAALVDYVVYVDLSLGLVMMLLFGTRWIMTVVAD